ncbi:SDR family NAD(P)-dependent oxidoreductase [Paenibacillus sp. J2TS4]|uniref:SDR family NAD(P)-dependent oxidoreductase n=1 Tax=Paenibacillus sp. J2TS4 TaxID=2807194 RepID=UPI001B195DB9|nr:SDR family NAD(P)-dependent oxidoreductase [Paenibacillus sp. J2TS4]GIP32254.1 short-chain dehydrogenase [Paenibacillus sp. J2TS4]
MDHVLITGANRGFGYECLKVYLSNHCTVYPVVRTEEAARFLEDAHPERCFPIIADLSDDQAKKLISEAVAKRTNRLDIVINNAGISGKEYLIEEVRTGEISDLFNIHCLGPIRVVQACLPLMRNSDNPRLINISSRLGSLNKVASGEFSDRHFSYSYRMAKAAQNMFSLCLSQELLEQNITVCAVHPGKLKTRMASTDADMEPSTGALNLYHWANSLTIKDTGSFTQPLNEEFPW